MIWCLGFGFPSCKQLQHRRREANQTERALWHWSLTLQAKVTLPCTNVSHGHLDHWVVKLVLAASTVFFFFTCLQVLHGWRLQVTEQRRKQEQAARAAQVYRDQLLREGVTCILTYAAHMSDLTTSLTQHSQEQVCSLCVPSDVKRESRFFFVIKSAYVSAEVSTSPQGGETLRHAVEKASTV